ncbi:hypothetical protein SCHPADRAFT_567193 [Schizopora paradoxa]|uniref:Uncharacterized protein n=1 Tax=Schizopora paradoxa TaxID=27342 RepID=A0A0H2RC39_9AGAM|nr:hypothetical protein SCHPADRAFT_567193 [Schizopora paradoxa]
MDDFKIRPRQVDDWNKGTYAPVVARSPPFRGGRFYGLVYVVILVVLGAVCAILHHVFYTHLNGKSIDDATNELPALLRSQDNVGNIGTTIAHGARIAFSMAIGVTFAQLFWEILRSGSHTIAQIDSLISCGQNPLQPSALRTIWTSFTLFAISVVASALALVVVFSPGALTVSSGAERRATCTAPTLLDGLSSPNSTYNTGSSQFPFGTLMVDFISTNSYLAPYQGNRSSICGFDMPCSYNLTFPGPTLSCEDNTDQLNLTTSPLGSPADTDGTLIIYDADIGYPSLGIDIAVHDLAKSQIQSFNCTTYNATYQVGIEGSPPSVRIWNVTQNSVLNYSMGFMSDYAELALDGISGQVLALLNSKISSVEETSRGVMRSRCRSA